MPKVKVIMLDNMIMIRELPEYFEKEMDKRNYMIHVAPKCFTLEDSQNNEIELLMRSLPTQFKGELDKVIKEGSRRRYSESPMFYPFIKIDDLYPKALMYLGLEQSDLEGDAIIFCVGDEITPDAADLLTLMVRRNKLDALVAFVHDGLGKTTEMVKSNIEMLMDLHGVTEEELVNLDNPTNSSNPTLRGFNQLANRLVEARGLWKFGYLLKVACIYLVVMRKT